MKYLINVILIILLLFSYVISTISKDDKGLFWMENPYLVITSAYDTTDLIDPIFASNKLIEIRETIRFQTLKDYAEINFKKPYLTIVNRISRRGTCQGILNNQDTIYYGEYVFVEIDTINKMDGHPQVKYLYYDEKDSICIFNDTETALSMRIMNNEELHLHFDMKLPGFMFDVNIIKVDENSEEIIITAFSFWRFKPECSYYDIDYILYEDDAYFIFSWMRYLAYNGIFTKIFGFTDFDMLY